MIMEGPNGHSVIPKVLRNGSRRKDREMATSERLDQLLLAVKRKEGASSQGMQQPLEGKSRK